MSENTSGTEPAETLPSGPSAAAGMPALIPRAPMTLGAILGATFRLIRQNPRPILGASALVGAGVAIVGVLIVVLAPGAPLPGVASYLRTGVSFFGQMVILGITAVLAAQAVSGRKPALSGLWVLVKPRVGLLLAWAALASIASTVISGPFIGSVQTARSGTMAGPTVLLVFGALIVSFAFYVVSVRLLFVAASITVENRSIIDAVRRSWSLTHRHFWRTVGIYLVGIIPVSVVVAGILAVTLGVSRVSIVAVVLTAILSVFANAIAGSLLAVMYLDLSFRRDGPGTAI